MTARFLLVTVSFVLALAASDPADAITINGVDYALLGRCKIGMENGPVKITGNIAVNEACGVQDGLLHIAAHNTVTGTATANSMFLGTNASVSSCEFNKSVGGNPAVACGVQGPAALPITAWPAGIPLPIPVVSIGTTNILCPPSCSPAPGSYRDITVASGATLTLSPGVYNARNVTVGNQAALNGSGAQLNLHETGSFVTEARAKINDVTVTSVKGQANFNAGGLGSTAEVIKTGNAAEVTNAIFYAPFARMHLHQAGTFTDFEGIAVLVVVEPVTIVNEARRSDCACIGSIAKTPGSIVLSSGCHLDSPTNQFFVSPTCVLDVNASCPGANCFSVTAQAGATESTATLNVPAVTAGNYHVIVRTPSGAFCTTQTVPLP